MQGSDVFEESGGGDGGEGGLQQADVVAVGSADTVALGALGVPHGNPRCGTCTDGLRGGPEAWCLTAGDRVALWDCDSPTFVNGP